MPSTEQIRIFIRITCPNKTASVYYKSFNNIFASNL